MTVNARITLDVTGSIAGVNDLGSPNMPFSLRELIDFTPGTLPGQADKVFADNRTIAASANDDLDLNGALPGPFGGTINFTAVRLIVIRAAAANVNDLIVGAAAANPFVGPFGASAHTLRIRPGDELVLSNRNAGWIVTPTTGDILRVANAAGGSAVNYDIILLGS
jgi:hypothetical protein